MRNLPFVLAAAFASVSCATTAPGSATGRELQSITLETGPCFGACPVYRLTVNADGSGTFEGRRFTAVEGERAFRATPAQFRAFADHLATLRPAHGIVDYSGEACAMTATDMPTTDVTWRGDGGDQHLHFYYGCDMDRNRPIGDRLHAAEDLLPVGDLIGRRN